MPAVLISSASPVDHAAEPDWLEWYNRTHVAEMRALLPEITTIEQYRVLRPDSPRPRFTTVYRIPALTAAQIAARFRDGGAAFSPSRSQPTGADASTVQIADVVGE